MFRKSFKYKIILPTAAIMVVLVAMLSAYSSSKFKGYSEAVFAESMESTANSLKTYVSHADAANSRDLQEVQEFCAPLCCESHATLKKTRHFLENF